MCAGRHMSDFWLIETQGIDWFRKTIIKMGENDAGPTGNQSKVIFSKFLGPMSFCSGCPDLISEMDVSQIWPSCSLLKILVSTYQRIAFELIYLKKN